jgi:cell division protein FtsB
MRGILVVPALLLLVALAHAALDEDAGVRQWWHLRAELADAELRIGVLSRELEVLRIEAQRLEEGGFATERAIREELGLVRPGQTLLRLPGDDVSSVRIP